MSLLNGLCVGDNFSCKARYPLRSPDQIIINGVMSCRSLYYKIPNQAISEIRRKHPDMSVYQSSYRFFTIFWKNNKEQNKVIKENCANPLDAVAIQS